MNETEMVRYMTNSFKGVDFVVDSGNHFFFYNPDPNVPPDHKFPFVTLVTNDSYDQASNLSRPDVFRLNIGVSKQTFRTLFGRTNTSDDEDAPENAYDFTALDTLMPHPVYGRMYWVSVLNPSPETFESQVLPLLSEAYEMAVGKYKK